MDVRAGPFVRVLVAIGLVSCAPAAPDAMHGRTAAGPAAQVTYGTIVAERSAKFGEASGMGASILAALGDAAPGDAAPDDVGDEASSSSETEFIVRQDDGRIVSIVQSAEPQLVAGERVMIVHGGETRLAPAG
ncbi:MAG: hypothetical protein ACREFZ_02645 [Acetobacteraceae bacterium]